MAIRSLQTVGTNLLNQARVLSPTVRAKLPSLPSDKSYATPWLISSGNLEADLKRGANAGVYVVQTPKFSSPSIWSGLGEFAKFAVGFFASKGSSLATTTLSELNESNRVSPTYFVEGTNMGLFDDIWGGVQSAAQGIFPTNQGIDWNGLLQSGVGLATQALTPRQPMMAAPMQTSMAPAMSAAGAVARVGATVGRGFFTRFPNLATAIQGLRNQGQNVTRAKLYGVLKRFGPEFLVTGGLLTAAAVNELAVAGPGYRRMNPANVRALRRSVRRIESFHRLCKTTDRLRGNSRRRKAHC